MRVTFLGTSAANAYPEAFCSCSNCQRARELGGRSIRRRSSVLINDDLLIDLGPDVQTSCNSMGMSLTRVRYCLQTHSHADHFDDSHLRSRSPSYGVVDAPMLHFYASGGTLRVADELMGSSPADGGLRSAQSEERWNLRVYEIEAFQQFSFGSYRVTVFPANHCSAVEPLLYAVQSQDRAIFYGTDTSVLSEEVWQAFHAHHLSFDLVVLDQTYGAHQDADDHLTARQVIDHVQRFGEEKLLNESARVLVTHIAHEGNPPHPELYAYAQRHGYEPAYDGMVVSNDQLNSQAHPER